MELPAKDPLFANHVAFMASHRGTLRYGHDWVQILGHAPFLSSWTPFSITADVPPANPPVRLVPASGGEWTNRLERRCYALAETLSYMSLECALAPRFAANGAAIRPAANDDDAMAFAEVQAAAFLDTGAEHRQWWVDCFRQMALANYRSDNQDFLIAWHEGVAVAVLLAVYAAGMTGLYAVATRPDFQGRGFSTALLGAACARARKRGSSRLVLQAMRGSYAEGFYGRRGFSEQYCSQVWRRPD